MSGPVAPHPPAAEAPQVVRPPSLGARVGVALLASAVAVALTIPLASVLARAIFLLGFAAVTLAAWYGGWSAGALAAVVCVLGLDYWVIPPIGDLRPTSPGDLAPMAGFVAVSLLIGRVHDALHAARDAAARRAAALVTANARLEAQATELAATNHALQEQATELESQQAELEQATQVLHEQQAAIEEHAAALAESNANLERALADAVQARDALAGSEARARLAVEAAQLGIWMWDLTTDTAAFDARVRELFGFPDDAPPRPAILAERAHPEDQARIAALLAAAADPAGDGRYDATYRVVRPDGTTRWALATGQMTFAGAGEARRPVSLFGTVRDVTAQYTAEAAVRAAESRFRAVQDTSPDGSVLVESVRAPAAPDGRPGPIVDFVYTYVNPAAERLTGRTAAEMIGRRVLALFPHIRAEGLFDAYVRVVETGVPFVTEREYVHDGMDHGLRITVVRVGDGFHIQFADVTARTRAAREAARAREAAERAAARTGTLQQLTAALADARTDDAVAEVVVAQTVAVTNAKTGAFLARPPGASMATIVRETGLPQPIAARFATLPPDAPGPAAAALRTGQAVFIGDRAELDARYPEIRDVWAAMDVAALATVPLLVGGEDGTPLVVGAMTYAFAAPRTFDAEEQAFFLALGRQAALALERVRLLETERAARREAETARQAAEAANQAKGAFLSTMSHELRTPLNAIAGYAELLALELRGPLTAAQREDLERLRRANQHMSGLVEAVLTFARVEAGQVDYRLEAVPIAPLLADVEALVAPQVAARALTYTHDGCGPDTPERPHVVRADAEKLRQILLNLVTNAIKFTDPGGRVALACEVEAAVEGAAGVVHVRVADTGRGIAADQHERVFQPFVQVDRARTHVSQQGVGLGLAISRDLARGMGGDLTVESTPGVGSTFTLTLPTA
jgi:PAS domain S-box-containing protein